MKKEKVLVFGSNGLVGSSVTEKLTNLTDKYKVYKPTRNEVNLFNFEKTNKLINEIQPNIIINAAARVGGIVANNTYRTEFLLENLKININILQSVIINPNINVINLGSSCIYPLEAQNPISEESLMSGKLEPTNSPYAMAKLTAIELGNAIAAQYGNKILNLMPTNLYGPRDNFSLSDSHVIPGLIARMHQCKINNDPNFYVWGTGEPRREFLFVDDLSDGILFFLENNIDQGIYNIGSGNEIKISKLVEKISKIIDYKGQIFFDVSKPDGNPRKLLDISKVSKLGWKPKVSLDEGLNLTYDWYIKNKF